MNIIKPLPFLILLVILPGCGRHTEVQNCNSVDVYNKLPDILADNGIGLVDLSLLPNYDKPEVLFVTPLPQKTDIINDGPRFYLYHSIEQNEYWIKVCGTINGSRMGWIGPLSEDYINCTLEAIEDAQCEQ